MLDRRTLQLLCCELSFLKVGGYGRKLRHSNWRATLMFRDSPVCLNFEPDSPHQPCERCSLFEFVPEQKRNTRMPCHHIQLNNKGETIATLYRKDTQEEMDAAVKHWLETTIEKLGREENGNEGS